MFLLHCNLSWVSTTFKTILLHEITCTCTSGWLFLHFMMKQIKEVIILHMISFKLQGNLNLETFTFWFSDCRILIHPNLVLSSILATLQIKTFVMVCYWVTEKGSPSPPLCLSPQVIVNIIVCLYSLSMLESETFF